MTSPAGVVILRVVRRNRPAGWRAKKKKDDEEVELGSPSAGAGNNLFADCRVKRTGIDRGRGDADARLPGAAMIWKSRAISPSIDRASPSRSSLSVPCISLSSPGRAGARRDHLRRWGTGGPAWRCGRRAVDPLPSWRRPCEDRVGWSRARAAACMQGSCLMPTPRRTCTRTPRAGVHAATRATAL